MMKKKKASGAIGYVMIFLMAIIMVMITLFMLASARFQTIQHDVDDALADSVLASLVADDVYYFKTYETKGAGTIRFKSTDASYRIYRDCMKASIENGNDLYSDIRYPVFICYEVEGSQVKVTSFNDSGGKSVTYGSLGSVKTPTGKVVTETSAYGKVTFKLQSLAGGAPLEKGRDLYCTLEIDE